MYEIVIRNPGNSVIGVHSESTPMTPGRIFAAVPEIQDRPLFSDRFSACKNEQT
jgi:hypothetical protein